MRGHNHDTEADTELDSLRARLRETQEEAEKYLASIKERQKELAALVDRCLLAESERDRWHKAFGEETLKHSAALRGRDRLHDEAANHYGLRIRAERERDAATQRAEEAEKQRDTALKAHKALLADYAGLQAEHFAATQRAEAAEARAEGSRQAVLDMAEEVRRQRVRTEDAVARAESAEARVKELEDHPPGIGDGDIQRVFYETSKQTHNPPRPVEGPCALTPATPTREQMEQARKDGAGFGRHLAARAAEMRNVPPTPPAPCLRCGRPLVCAPCLEATSLVAAPAPRYTREEVERALETATECLTLASTPEAP